jgi:hypothetical protein
VVALPATLQAFHTEGSGPTLDDDEDDDESEHLTALTAAAYSENLEILKRLKPDAETDDIDSLLSTAAVLVTPTWCGICSN